jgi:hypothetical protein
MWFCTLQVYKYVINEDHNKLDQLRHEYGVHEVHEVCQRVCQPKRHDKILIKLVSHRESHLGDIFGMNLNLMVARAKINLGEHSRSG